MKILFWIPFWPIGNNIFFHKDSFFNNLLPQARLLASKKCDITIVCSDAYKNSYKLDSIKSKNIFINQREINEFINSYGDISSLLYNNDKDTVSGLVNLLHNKIDNDYDFVFLWETPGEFFHKICNDCTIINQMPGSFNRAPFASTAIFDIYGLYKNFSFNVFYDNIKNINFTETENTFFDNFKHSIYSYFSDSNLAQYIKKITRGFRKVYLLPLQISSNYAYRVDTGFSSQIELLLAAKDIVDNDSCILVTEYASKFINENIFSNDLLMLLKGTNIIYDQKLNSIYSSSQYILPLVDGIITSSSSLGIQAMLYDKEIHVIGNTYLKNFECINVNDAIKLRNENILKFITTRQQPLSSKIFHDSNFLCKLLNTISEHKTLYNDISFELIDKNYFAKYISSLRIYDGRKNYYTSYDRNIKDIKEKISSSDINIVSFDLFDTLITRTVDKPKNIFNLLEERTNKVLKNKYQNIAKLREISERLCRHDKNNSEITLDDIYKKMGEICKINEVDKNRIKNLEIDIEIEKLKLKEDGYFLLNHAIEENKKIIIITDMYMDSYTIKKILDIFNIKYDTLYLSSELNRTKKHGDIYEYVTNNEKCNPENILHIGDNKKADINNASAYGITTCYINNSASLLRTNKLYKDILKLDRADQEFDLWRNTYIKLIADRLYRRSSECYNDSLFNGNVSNIGYIALGPILFGYMRWLYFQAKSKKIKNIYFLSREGMILKKCFDIFNNIFKGDIKTYYMYASRRCLRFASIETIKDIFDIVFEDYNTKASISSVLYNKFCLDESDVPNELLKKHGFSNRSNALSSVSEYRIKLFNLCCEVKNIIFEKSKNERDIYLEYLKSIKFSGDTDSCIVDIGWQGNMQGALGNLINRKLIGFYYASSSNSRRWTNVGHEINSYFDDYFTIPSSSKVVEFPTIIEYLTCYTDPSLIRMQKVHDDFIPIFRDEASIDRIEFITEIYEGAIEFINECVKYLHDDIKYVYINKHFCEQVYYNYVSKPTYSDAKLFLGQATESLWASRGVQYFIHNTNNNIDINKSIWKQGAKCIKKNESKKICFNISIKRKLIKLIKKPKQFWLDFFYKHHFNSWRY